MKKTLLFITMLCLAVSASAQLKSRVIEDGGTGPYKAVMTEVEGLPEHTVFMPQDLSVFNAKNPLPVLVWGNGACSNSPWEHMNFLNEIASHGYMVLATGNIPMVDEWYQGPMSRSEQQIESIDWAYAQNANPQSPYFQKIAVSDLCVAGMSCGGLQTLFNCADPRIKALMICNSGLFNQQNASQAVGGMPMPPKDKLKEIHTPILYILGGPEDIAYGNGMDDFHRIDHVPACAVNYPVGHGGTYREPHGGEFTVPALAWLNWQLKGDAEAAKTFVGKDCGLLKRDRWTIDKNAQFDALNVPLLKTSVETGEVAGVLEGSLAVYKAIPYAAPPVGDLRWKAPQPAKAWEGVRVCDQFGPMPPQPTRPGRTADMMSEDCLYLGIATPAATTEDKLPVMVWIHGGGFQTEWYGGDLWKYLAQRGVVIVSIEYRTGALGFMVHPELAKEDPEGHAGNYGILDQIFALQWVQRNIANFGGDPTNVTIFGESAGAISCSILCASPLAKGLFHRCISQSGGSFAPWRDAPRSLGMDASQKGAEQQGIAFQQHLKKKNLKQLRQMDAMSLCDGNVGFAGFWPCVDGYVICDDQYRLYERGEYNDVPIIVMTNSDEGALFAPGNITAEDYQKSVEGIFGDMADEAKKVYPGSTNDEAWHGFGDAFRDMGFAWPSYAWVSLQAKTGKSPAYAAYLAQPSKMSFSPDKRRRGVAHADDILYLNGHFLTQSSKYPAESAVAEIIQEYWVNFAKTGNPNGKGLPFWPTFDDATPTTMQFANGASLIMRPNREQVDFVDHFYKVRREQTEAQRKARK
jgi:para-nitrobenzyl esterase